MSSNTLLNFDINYEDIIRTPPEEALEQVLEHFKEHLNKNNLGLWCKLIG